MEDPSNDKSQYRGPQLIPDGLALPDPVPMLARADEHIITAKATLDSLRFALRGQVASCMSRGHQTLAECRRCIDDAIKDKVKDAIALEQELGDTARLAIDALVAQAWEYAEQMGCIPRPATMSGVQSLDPPDDKVDMRGMRDRDTTPIPNGKIAIVPTGDGGMPPPKDDPLPSPPGLPSWCPGGYGYYTYLAPSRCGSKVAWCLEDGRRLSPPPGYTFLFGPFSTEYDAYQAGIDYTLAIFNQGDCNLAGPPIPTPDSTDGWYVYMYDPGCVYIVTYATIGKFDPPVGPQFTLSSGPYKTREEAIRAADARIAFLRASGFCPPATPPCPEPVVCGDRSVWKTATYRCYVQLDGLPPGDPTDTLIVSGVTTAQANAIVDILCSLCLKMPDPGNWPEIPCVSFEIPPIGSERFCALVPGFLEYFKLIGGLLLPALISTEGENGGFLKYIIIGILRSIPMTPPVREIILNGIFSSIGVNPWSDLLVAWRQMLSCIAACDIDAYIGIVAVRSLARSLESLTAGINFGLKITTMISLNVNEISKICDYLAGYLCPTSIPSMQESVNLYLSGQITSSHLECLSKMSGFHWEHVGKIVNAQRRRLGTAESMRAWFRGIIGDEQRDSYMTQDGVIYEYDRSVIQKLAYETPSVSSIIRYMVKDIEDRNIVERFGLDSEFEQKAGPQILQWQRATGMTPEHLRAEWKSHWQNMSNTALFTMLHRLRAEKNDPERTTTQEDIDFALGQNDILPFWRKRLTAISYSLLTRVDARRAYNVGLMTDEQLASLYQDRGYTREDARRIVEFNKHQLKEAIDKNRFVKEYEKGARNEESLRLILTRYGQRPEIIRDAIVRARERVKVEGQGKCVEALRKRYFIGDLSSERLRSELLTIGLDVEWVDDRITQWTCEFNVRGKEIPGARLCKWLTLGLISPNTMIARLVRIGYQLLDAQAILAECEVTIAERARETAERRHRERERAEEKARKAAEKAAKDAERKRRAEETARNQQMRAERSIETNVLRIAQKLSTRWEMPIEDVSDTISSTYEYLRDLEIYSPEAISTIIGVAAGLESAGTVAGWTRATEQAREAYQEIVANVGH